MQARQSPQTNGDFVDLRVYFAVLRRRAIVIIVLAALGLGLAVGYSKLQTPIYAATTHVLVNPPPGGSRNPNNTISVDAYEIPDRIRERIKLTHPVELFPFGTQETHHGMDLDHLQPYDPLGPPGQTSTTTLAPLGRYAHRVKTHAPGWTVHRINPQTLEWTTPHGFRFHVDPTGTHRVHADPDSRPSC